MTKELEVVGEIDISNERVVKKCKECPGRSHIHYWDKGKKRLMKYELLEGEKSKKIADIDFNRI